MILCSYHQSAGLFAIHEPLGNGIRSEDFIPAKKGYGNKTHLSFLRNYGSIFLRLLSYFLLLVYNSSTPTCISLHL